MLRVLTFSSLYPNVEQPEHGVFVEQRLRRLVATERVHAEVIAPVPWFPFASNAFGGYGRFARVPKTETRHAIEIAHPRYPLVPKIGMLIAPLLMALAVLPEVRRRMRRGKRVSLIDAHYLYPDGVAGALLSTWLRVPLVLTARGSDVNLIGRMKLPKRMIRWSVRRADAVITVSAALRDVLVEMGCESDKIHVIRNGVDLELFAPCDRDQARTDLKLARPTILSVGKLDENKGHHLIVEALQALPNFELVVVGEGPSRGDLEKLARKCGVADRVRFAGAVRHGEMKRYYSAADMLVLGSAREGMPNVVLEALACGLPVAATRVGGIAEVLEAAPNCRLLPVRSANAIEAAVRAIVAQPVDRSAIRNFALNLGWDTVIATQLKLLNEVATRSHHL